MKEKESNNIISLSAYREEKLAKAQFPQDMDQLISALECDIDEYRKAIEEVQQALDEAEAALDEAFFAPF